MTSNMLADIIASKGWCVADGATGTNLFARGLETGYPPELWSVERPGDILWLHNSFLDAGSDLILTNSFGGTISNTPALAGNNVGKRIRRHVQTPFEKPLA